MKKYILIVLCILLVLYVFFARDVISFTLFQQAWAFLNEQYMLYPIVFASLYFCLYLLLSAIPTPGMVWLSLLGASIMGFPLTFILVSFASSLGSTLSMLCSRYFFHDSFIQRFPAFYAKVKKGFEQNGLYYLFMLRLIPAPFFLVNILFGLTPVTTAGFYIVSQIGMIPTTMLVTKTGAELGLIQNLQEIFSLKILLLFVAIGVFPLIMKKIFHYCMPQSEGIGL